MANTLTSLHSHIPYSESPTCPNISNCSPRRTHHSMLFPNPLYVIHNISSHSSPPTCDGAHPPQTFPYNPELFPCSCLTSLNPESLSWLSQLLLLCLTRLQATAVGYSLTPSSPTSFTIPGEIKPLHLLSQRSKSNKNPQAESCYQKMT